jgi:RNA polymerase sigma-70 factor, ECF subfamily
LGRRLTKAHLRALADEELMLLAGGGEVCAFEVIFDRHAGTAYALACRICRQSQMAEDVVQEAFLSLWRSYSRFDRARGNVRSWVLSVVHNRAIDALRRARVSDGRVVCDEDAVVRKAADVLTDVEALRRNDARTLRRALDELPGDQRQVVELSFFAGLSHHQIAELLQLAPGTVKGRIRLGLQKLRPLVESDFIADTSSDHELAAAVRRDHEHAAVGSLVVGPERTDRQAGGGA